MNNQRHTGIRRFRVAKVKDPSLRLCPCCCRVDEDDNHVLLCNANPGRMQAMRVLRRTMDSASILPPVKAFKNLVMRWLDGQQPVIDLSEYPLKHHKQITTAATQQSRIGWSAAMRGFLTIEWSYLASLPAGDNKQSNQAKGLQTMKKILVALHQFSLSVWKERNRVIHGPDSTGLRELRCPELLEITNFTPTQNK